MNPASQLINKHGLENVAKWAERSRGRVLRWTYSSERGGTNGRIPQAVWQNIIRNARVNGDQAGRSVIITQSELMPILEVAE